MQVAVFGRKQFKIEARFPQTEGGLSEIRGQNKKGKHDNKRKNKEREIKRKRERKMGGNKALICLNKT